jgi:hypothetical protein
MYASFFDFSEASWEGAGFVAEMESYASVYDCTFLKGRYSRFTDGLDRYGTLPGAIVKLGKCLVELSTQKKVDDMARGQGLGLGYIPYHVPLLGPFYHKMISFSDHSRELREDYKRDSDFSGDLDVEEYMEFVCRRYEVTVLEIREAEMMIDAVDRLPAVVAHRVFAQLAIDH